MTLTMALTPEQDDAVARYLGGANVVVEALAGTGKTTTIRAMVQADPRPGTYVAYNRAIVDDVGAHLDGTPVRARTAHSLAFGAVGRRYAHRLRSERMSSREVARILGLSPLEVSVRGHVQRLSAAFLAGCVMEGTRHFANSADPVPGAQHLPWIEALDEVGKTDNDTAYRAHCLGALERAWGDLASVHGQLRFSHDCYLKIWALTAPQVPGDVLFVDEAQDVNPVLAGVVMGQGGQIVAVGDSYQQIYAWRGAIDALEVLKGQPGTTSCWLTTSFRFGPEIAKVANKALSLLGAPVTLTGSGAPGAVEHAVRPDAILCRTNAGVISALLHHGQERRCAIVGGGGELVAFARGLIQLRDAGHSTHPELVCFSSLEELQAHVTDDPSGQDLALLTRLCLRYGPEEIIEAIDACVPEGDDVLTLSTAHRAKGRQWDVVALGTDWPERTLSTPDELRLCYVAVTRARRVLDLSDAPVLASSLR